MIRAKIQITEVTKTAYGQEIATGQAVYTGGDENKSFSEATPSLDLKISVSNPAAHGFFQPGKEYLLDFTPASETPVAQS